MRKLNIEKLVAITSLFNSKAKENNKNSRQITWK